MRLSISTLDPGLRQQLASSLAMSGFDTISSSSGETCDLHIIDLDAPGAVGEIAAVGADSRAVAVAISSDARSDTVVRAMRLGATSVLAKPFGGDDLRRAVRSALGQRERHGSVPATVAVDPSIRRLLEDLQRAAPSDLTVWITGESGTGKTHLARVVHAASPRRSSRMVLVPCADLTETDAEVTLLGRSSAGPSADDRRGAVEMARGGTLVLEGIDETPRSSQALLTEILQQRTAFALGGAADAPVDVRIVATSRQRRAEAVGEGLLIPELGVLLDVISVGVPPLRERPDDLAHLADHFLESFAEREGTPRPILSPDARAQLAARPFPGNLRELRNLMQRAAVLFPGQSVDVNRLDRPLTASQTPLPADLGSFDLRAIERAAIERCLELTAGNRTLAARALGVSTRTLRSKLRSYGRDGGGARDANGPLSAPD